MMPIDPDAAYDARMEQEAQDKWAEEQYRKFIEEKVQEKQQWEQAMADEQEAQAMREEPLSSTLDWVDRLDTISLTGAAKLDRILIRAKPGHVLGPTDVEDIRAAIAALREAQQHLAWQVSETDRQNAILNKLALERDDLLAQLTDALQQKQKLALDSLTSEGKWLEHTGKLEQRVRELEEQLDSKVR